MAESKTKKQKTTTKQAKSRRGKSAAQGKKKRSQRPAVKKTQGKRKESSRVQGTIKRSLTRKALEKEILFAFYAPLSSKVGVAGSFNNWDAGAAELVKDKDGTWRGSLRLRPGKYEYKFLVDEEWQNAQAEHELVDNGFGGLNNVLRV